MLSDSGRHELRHPSSGDPPLQQEQGFPTLSRPTRPLRLRENSRRTSTDVTGLASLLALLSLDLSFDLLDDDLLLLLLLASALAFARAAGIPSTCASTSHSSNERLQPTRPYSIVHSFWLPREAGQEGGTGGLARGRGGGGLHHCNITLNKARDCSVDLPGMLLVLRCPDEEPTSETSKSATRSGTEIACSAAAATGWEDTHTPVSRTVRAPVMLQQEEIRGHYGVLTLPGVGSVTFLAGRSSPALMSWISPPVMLILTAKGADSWRPMRGRRRPDLAVAVRLAARRPAPSATASSVFTCLKQQPEQGHSLRNSTSKAVTDPTGSADLRIESEMRPRKIPGRAVEREYRMRGWRGGEGRRNGVFGRHGETPGSREPRGGSTGNQATGDRASGLAKAGPTSRGAGPCPVRP